MIVELGRRVTRLLADDMLGMDRSESPLKSVPVGLHYLAATVFPAEGSCKLPEIWPIENDVGMRQAYEVSVARYPMPRERRQLTQQESCKSLDKRASRKFCDAAAKVAGQLPLSSSNGGVASVVAIAIALGERYDASADPLQGRVRALGELR